MLVDPTGRCPDGHTVGAAGARVAAAIGSAVPHPEEPQPWVGRVELEAPPAPSAPTAAPAPVVPRAARPPSVLPADAPAPAPLPVATDDLLRELHALGDLASPDVVPAKPIAAAPAAAPAAPPAAPAAPAAVVPPVAAHVVPQAAAPIEAPVAPLAPVAPSPVAPPTVAPPTVAPTAVAPPTVAPTAVAPPAATPPAAAPPTLAPAPTIAATPAPPSSPEDTTDLDELASLAAAVRALDTRHEEPTPVGEGLRFPQPDAPPAEVVPGVLAAGADPADAGGPDTEDTDADVAASSPTIDGANFTARGPGRGRRAGGASRPRSPFARLRR
ncbi:hypothetical protein FTX61_03045 [Nitriliruptoraceae bacterium ZYF776]|nr:hypothetical protein [Profundirhabdus halotolerans]